MKVQKFGKKPNLMIIGASGGVARALLQILHLYRNDIDKLILIDKCDEVTKSNYLNHKKLNYKFIEMKINNTLPLAELKECIEQEKINILLDVTDSETLPIVQTCEKVGVSYINTSINSDSLSVVELFKKIEEIRQKYQSTPHILSMGMNPGIVNIWTMIGIKNYGIPNEIIEIEYDNAFPLGEWQPIITWSKKQFLMEAIYDATGYIQKGGKYKIIQPNALANQVDTEPYLKDIWQMRKYPKGMIVTHDEILSMGTRWKVPVKFIYAINQQTLEWLTKRHATKQVINEDELALADNTKIHIKGQDTIGIILIYQNKKIIFSNTMYHANFHSTNATLMQVAIGVLVGLKELINGNVMKGINFPEDLDIDSALSTLQSHMLINYKEIKIKKNKFINKEKKY